MRATATISTDESDLNVDDIGVIERDGSLESDSGRLQWRLQVAVAEKWRWWRWWKEEEVEEAVCIDPPPYV